MNFTQDLISKFDDGNPLSIIVAAVVIITLVFIAWQAFCGFRKGIILQGLKTGITVIAAAIALIVTGIVSNNIFNSTPDVTNAANTIESFTGGSAQGLKDIVANLDTEIVSYLVAMLFSVLAAPFLFLTIFTIINSVFRVVYYIVTKIIPFPKGGKLTTRLIATAIGVLHGFLVAAIVMLPFIAVSDVVNAAVDASLQATENAELEDVNEKYISPATNNPVFATVRTLGGNAVLNSFGNLSKGDEKFEARKEFFNIIDGGYSKIEALSETEFSKLEDNDKQAIEDLLKFVNESEFLTTFSSGIFTGVGRAMEEGNITKDVDEPLKTILDHVATIFATGSKETLESDLGVMKEIYFILSDADILIETEDSRDITSKFTAKIDGDTVIGKIAKIINSNSRFAPLLTAITEISISHLIDSAEGQIPNSAQVYSEIKTGFNKILAIEKPTDPKDTEAFEEYKQNVSGIISDTLSENNITLDPDVIDGISDYIATPESEADEIIGKLDSDGNGELTDQEFNNILLQYYDSYLENSQPQ